MKQRQELIMAAAQATIEPLFEILKADLIGFRHIGATPAEVASFAATVGAEFAFRAVGLATIVAKEESREALVDEALLLIAAAMRSRRDELIERVGKATGAPE